MLNRFRLLALSAAYSLSVSAFAADHYGPGVTDTEIKIGQTAPYSGPSSSYSVVGRMHSAYFRMLNETQGGINGRKVINLATDDGMSPPKTVEVTRKLVEEEQVLAMIGSVGTASQVAVQKYLNQKKVPQLVLYASSPTLHDPKNFPFTMPFSFAYNIEGSIYGSYLRKERPRAKVAVLYLNDDFGKSYLRGFKAALEDRADMIVKETSYEASEPTVDSQIVQLESSGADTFFAFVLNKAGAQAIRKIGSSGWKPFYVTSFPSSSITSVLTPAGLGNATGVISSQWFKSPGDPAWNDDPAMRKYLAFMAQYMPGDDPGDTTSVYAYLGAQLTALALQRCGNELTRENLIRQMQAIHGVDLDLLLPGVQVNYSRDDYYPIRQARLVKFDGKSWTPLTEVISVNK
ncbi:MAG: ABC transporter substrate-binding protein [Burkholderiaceae bacterium]